MKQVDRLEFDIPQRERLRNGAHMSKKLKEPTPVIVLGCHKLGLGVIRALGELNIPIVGLCYNKMDMGYVSKYVKETIYAPHPEKFEKQFINLLEECAKRFEGSLLLPSDDPTLLVVARNKELLERHYIVACTDREITERFIDKKFTYELAEQIGVPAPKTIVLRSDGDVGKYCEAIEYPCVVKPCQSHRYYEVFKKKMVRVENIDQMILAYQQASEFGIEMMLQELIPGDDTHGVNYNSYFWDDECLVEFTAKKIRLGPPGFGTPCVLVSKYIPEIIEPGRKILRALGFYGYSCTEFKKDERDGIYKLMEINGRSNLSVLHALKSGINFPWITYNHLINGELPFSSDFKCGIYWIDSTKDFFYSFQHYKQDRCSLFEYLKPYIKPHIFAIFNLKDIKPFIKRCFDFLEMAFQAVFKILKQNFFISKG